MSKKLSETLRRKAAEQGLLPHEILLKVARGEPIKHTEVQSDGTLSEVDLYPSLDALRMGFIRDWDHLKEVVQRI